MFRRIVVCGVLSVLSSAPLWAQSERTAEQVFKAACVSCHGPDGKGQPEAILGFTPPDTFPDFTDCPVSSVEPDDLWRAVITRGGRSRGLSHVMPAFGDVLTAKEIDDLVQYLHNLCAEPKWPRGNLNFPRPMFTMKAFPENEAVFTFNMVPSHPSAIEAGAEFEQRLGKRAQYEVSVPFSFEQTSNGPWNSGMHAVNLAYKYAFYDSFARGTIASAGAELAIFTEREVGEDSHGASVFEVFGLFGQALPRDAFIQVHAGFERSLDHDLAPNAVYWRTAFGKTIKYQRWGRLWTPMVEVLADRELADGAKVHWDVVPQMQVSLSVFQHIRMSVGVRLPVTGRETRSKALVAYFLWDWFDAGIFDHWRAH